MLLFDETNVLSWRPHQKRMIAMLVINCMFPSTSTILLPSLSRFSKLRFLVIPYATQRHPIQTKNWLKDLQQNTKPKHRLAGHHLSS
jgi:S-methylmethionine-dependent homocysteine/selenocysteine methylase